MIGRKKGCCIVEEVIEVDEFDEVDICCSMKVKLIRKHPAELCHTQTFYFLIYMGLHDLLHGFHDFYKFSFPSKGFHSKSELLGNLNCMLFISVNVFGINYL